jgi:hypothetical protein
MAPPQAAYGQLYPVYNIWGNLVQPQFQPLPAFFPQPIIPQPIKRPPQETPKKIKEERMDLGKKHIRRKRRSTLKRGSRK